MKRTLGCLVGLLALSAVTENAVAQSQQIRINKNTCSIYTAQLHREMANPLYAKAVAAKKLGHPLPMQQDRLDNVESLRSLLRALHCK